MVITAPTFSPVALAALGKKKDGRPIRKSLAFATLQRRIIPTCRDNLSVAARADAVTPR